MLQFQPRHDRSDHEAYTCVEVKTPLSPSAGEFYALIDTNKKTGKTTLTISGTYGEYEIINATFECRDEDSAKKAAVKIMSSIQFLCSEGLLYNPKG